MPAGPVRHQAAPLRPLRFRMAPGDAEGGGRWDCGAPALPGHRLPARRDHVGGQDAEGAPPRLQHEAVEVAEVAHGLLRHPVRHAADGVAAEAVPDGDDAAQLLRLHEAGGAVHEHVERDAARKGMLALAEAGPRRREHPVPLRVRRVRGAAPAPAAVPSAVDEHVGLRRPAADAWLFLRRSPFGGGHDGRRAGCQRAARTSKTSPSGRRPSTCRRCHSA